MAEDKKQHPIVDLAVATSTATATITFGGQIWRAPVLPVERVPPDNPIYSLVGQIASDWAYVEHTLDTVIWELAAVEPENGACITAQIMSVYSRCKAIVALLTLYQRRTGKDLGKLITTATDLGNRASGPGEKRNRAIHDPWYTYTGTRATGQFKAMAHKDHRYGIHPVDLNNLQSTLQEIETFSARVKAFRADVLATLKASP